MINGLKDGDNRRFSVFEHHGALESNPYLRRLGIKKRFTEEKIIGFLREAEPD